MGRLPAFIGASIGGAVGRLVGARVGMMTAFVPTTALDVTVQEQVLGLMQDIQREEGMAIVLVTHDLGVVARMADDVAVMYAGQVVESGSAEDVFYRHAHPYTAGLLEALPGSARGQRERLQPIAGSPPDVLAPPPGCAYAARCPHAMRICASREPPELGVGPGHVARCWLRHAESPGGAAGREGSPP